MNIANKVYHASIITFTILSTVGSTTLVLAQVLPHRSSFRHSTQGRM